VTAKDPEDIPMQRLVGGLLALVLPLAAPPARDTPATPAEQYRALVKQYQAASGGGASSDEERLKMIGRVYRLRNKLALELVELAEKHPKDPIAVDALIQATWQVNNTWPVELVGKDDAQPRALAILQRDHVRSEKLGSVCQRISFGFCEEYETFLRAMLKGSPHEDVQALACLGLAHFLNNRLQRLALIEEQPPLAKEFEGLYGKEYLARLKKQDRVKATEEAEAFFERAEKKYGDVKHPEGGTVGDRAKSELFEIRHLSVGKEAPKLEGDDQDGKRFALADYRGKVVLLDFWSQY
jgi:hypothetical protein